MKKKLTAIIAAVTLVLAIDASAFNVTISANDANNPWACYAAPGTTLPGGMFGFLGVLIMVLR
jgi:hypothetical protein